MLRSTIRLDLRSDHVLSDVTTEFDTPLVATREEVYDDDTLTFVAEVEHDRDAIAEAFETSPAVTQVGTVGKHTLVVRKRSSGAIPVIRSHDGMLCGVDRAFGTERVFDVMAFSREDIRAIVDDLNELGRTQIERLADVRNRPAGLSQRQYDAVEAALVTGYYDWPREATAEAVAETMGVAHSTFLEHLRKAEKKLLERALLSDPAESFGTVVS